jgi:hypothetical protein
MANFPDIAIILKENFVINKELFQFSEALDSVIVPVVPSYNKIYPSEVSKNIIVWVVSELCKDVAGTVIPLGILVLQHCRRKLLVN